MKKYLSHLNDAQLEAVLHGEKPALVLAGPGSGKTSVITARTLRLIDELNIPANRILTVTFSRAAADEMKKRFIKVYSDLGQSLDVIPEYGTLHGFCYGILRNSDFFNKQVKVLCDNAVKYNLLSEIWHKINPGNSSILTIEYMDFISSSISKVKCLTGKADKSEILKEVQIRNFYEVYCMYEEYKAENGLLDFDDMISSAKKILSSDDLLQHKISQKYDFIQIDEGQDMSLNQIEIMKFVGLHNNVFMVADDDQGIYGFRGADVKSINLFESYFEGCVRYYLEQNYRSAKNIVATASAFVEKNKLRYGKKLFTLNEDGSEIELLKPVSVETQARFAAEIAIANSAAGKTSGILYRGNISALMPLLYIYHLSHRKGIKATLNIAGGIIHPDKYDIVKTYYGMLEKEAKRKSIFSKDLYETYRDLDQNKELDKFRRLGEIKGMRAKDIEYILSFLRKMSKLLNGIEQVTEFFDMIKNTDTESGISFSTVHSSKGLEYDCVIILDATEDEFPKQNTIKESDIEEERRLFYVAMTRAKKKLYILAPQKCGKIKCMPGLFFYETEKILKA